MNSTAQSRIQALREAMPSGGLFHEKSWRLSPDPFVLPPGLDQELEKLGYRLLLFQKACNLLYNLSVDGKQDPWIADLLDRGKPPELIALARNRKLRNVIPQVIRPDLILTDQGFVVSELDSVPGGIGLTGWLNQTYARMGFSVLGGADGMVAGFQSLFPDGVDIIVSEESSDYRPEMRWLCEQLEARSGGNFRVMDATSGQNVRATVYRFFELHDLANVPIWPELAAALEAGDLTMSPPPKPALEEKLWFALFWLAPLREFWRRELGEKQFLALQKVIPYTWLLDPTPLPRHAVLPRLEIPAWKELASLSQNARHLVIKVSGFSELAWGARGVQVGHDLPRREWSEAIDQALSDYPRQPHILQQFHTGAVFSQQWWNPETDALETMTGRIRLCPYYFIRENKAHLSGALATICPADKKLLHGMADAILVPAGL